MRGKLPIPHLAILVGAVVLTGGCAANKIESFPKDPEAKLQTEKNNSGSTTRHPSVDKIKKVNDVPDEKAVKKLAPTTWQESFVENHAGGASSGSGPLYDQYWSDVEKVSHDVLNSGGNKGSVTRAALAKNIEDGTFKGSEAQVAGALYESFDQIKPAGKLSSIFTRKINEKDISTMMSKVKDSEKQFHDIDDLTYWSDNQKNLQRFSSDGSGSVTYKDLTQALDRKDLSPSDRENLQELELKFHAIAPDGTLGKRQIDNYYESFINNDSGWKLGKQITDDMRHIATAQNDPNTKMLYADSDPLESVKVGSVTQGFAGDCAFKAALAGVVATNPESVVQMLHAKSANDLQIDFPGQKEPVQIKTPSDEEIGLYSGAGNRGNWASALEKGYGELVYENSPNKKALQGMVGADKAASMVFSEAALRALTGHQIERLDVTEMSDSQLRSTLTAAQQDKMAVVLNTPPGDNSQNTKGGYAIDHAFTVLGINSKGEVTIRDPRANGQNRPDGVTQISLDALKDNFKQLFVETNKPLA
jgi:hypothetical protein